MINRRNVELNLRWTVVVACAVFVLLAVIAVPIWQTLCGNHRIALYGKVVDTQGVAIPDVKIKVQIVYSPHIALPIMYGRGERLRSVEAVTDNSGNFKVTGEYGYGVQVLSFKWSGRSLVDGPPPYPPSSFSYPLKKNALSSASNPVTYVFNREQD